MPLVLIAVALVILVGLWTFISLSITLVGLLLHLFMAGLAGSWLGVLLIGHRGPILFGVPLIPGFVGALILAFVLSAVGKQQIRRA